MTFFRSTNRWITILLMAFSLSACATVPYQSLQMPAQDSTALTVFEEEMGQKVYDQSKTAFGFSSDQKSLRRVEEIAKKILPYVHRQNIPYTFYILDTPLEFAYAAPDGSIYLGKGMTDLFMSDDALAALLAHELAHISLKHSVNSYSRQAFTNEEKARRKVMTDYMITLFSVGLIEINDDGLELIVEQKHSKAEERDADLLSVHYLMQAGIKPEAAIEMLESFKKVKGSESLFFSTHPSHSDRIEFVKKYISEITNAKGV